MYNHQRVEEVTADLANCDVHRPNHSDNQSWDAIVQGLKNNYIDLFLSDIVIINIASLIREYLPKPNFFVETPVIYTHNWKNKHKKCKKICPCIYQPYNVYNCCYKYFSLIENLKHGYVAFGYIQHDIYGYYIWVAILLVISGCLFLLTLWISVSIERALIVSAPTLAIAFLVMICCFVHRHDQLVLLFDIKNNAILKVEKRILCPCKWYKTFVANIDEIERFENLSECNENGDHDELLHCHNKKFIQCIRGYKTEVHTMSDKLNTYSWEEKTTYYYIAVYVFDKRLWYIHCVDESFQNDEYWRMDQYTTNIYNWYHYIYLPKKKQWER